MTTLQILHLEDDTFDADLVRREVARLHGEAAWITAATADAFHDAMAHQTFDAVLSDNRIAGMDGLEALRLVQARRPGVPFIFVSGNADPRWAEHCLEAGATDYVPKHELWRLPSALRRLDVAREQQRLATLTDARAALVDAVRDLSLARTERQVVDVVCRAARRISQADGATFVLRDGDLCHYVDEDAVSPLWAGERFPMASCISGWVMAHARAAIIPDVHVDPRIPQDVYRRTFVHSLVMVPIRAKAPLGAIGAYWARAHEATADEVNLVQALADSTALALENVALIEGLERRVQERTEALEVVNRELEAFSYSVSHDLRAPLRAVSGYTDMLLSDVSPPLEGDARQFAENVQRSATRMGVLIEDLLSLSKVSRAALHVREVPIGRMAADVLADLQAGDPARRVALDVDEGLHARGDPGLLRIALENLLANAWKFTGRCEAARIAFHGVVDADGRTVFTVADNGAGFDMKYAAQLFEPFRRLHRESEFPGTGVGLAIVHRIVAKHGGEIRAESAPGQGSRFTFTLPGGRPKG